MKQVSLKKLAEKMKALDFCMMVTQDGRNVYHARPMSNNRQVEYDGNSYFFSMMDTNKVRHIEKDAKVTLIYQTDDMLFMECYGHATILTQRSRFEEHWTAGLERWFKDGIDTEGLCLIRVEARRVQFWHKEEEGEYKSAS